MCIMDAFRKIYSFRLPFESNPYSYEELEELIRQKDLQDTCREILHPLSINPATLLFAFIFKWDHQILNDTPLEEKTKIIERANLIVQLFHQVIELRSHTPDFVRSLEQFNTTFIQWRSADLSKTITYGRLPDSDHREMAP